MRDVSTIASMSKDELRTLRRENTSKFNELVKKQRAKIHAVIEVSGGNNAVEVIDVEP